MCAYTKNNFYCLTLLCAFFFLLIPYSALCAAHPASYSEAKAALELLQKSPQKAKYRSSWMKIANDFYTIYQENEDWSNRPAALIRSARALAGMAQYSGSKKDCQDSIDRFLLVPQKHPASPLADDALYEAAALYDTRLKDKSSAVKLLRRITSEYPKSDFAPTANAYLKKLEGAAPEKKAKKESSRPPLPNWNAPRNIAAQLGLKVNTIILDAGHGGKDPGAQHNGITEKNITLDMANRLAKILRSAGYNVLLTRDKDAPLSLEKRGHFAASKNGDLFISIHVNANDDAKIRGMEIYYLNFTDNKYVVNLAARENSGIDNKLGDMEKILTRILLTARVQESRHLADLIQKNTLKQLKSKGFQHVDNGIKGAPFYVLIAPSMPGVLVELGYCTNSADSKNLQNTAYRNALAAGIAQGIKNYAEALSNS